MFNNFSCNVFNPRGSMCFKFVKSVWSEFLRDWFNRHEQIPAIVFVMVSFNHLPYVAWISIFIIYTYFFDFFVGVVFLYSNVSFIFYLVSSFIVFSMFLAISRRLFITKFLKMVLFFLVNLTVWILCQFFNSMRSSATEN